MWFPVCHTTHTGDGSGSGGGSWTLISDDCPTDCGHNASTVTATYECMDTSGTVVSPITCEGEAPTLQDCLATEACDQGELLCGLVFACISQQ
jgi:hypothetical protein